MIQGGVYLATTGSSEPVNAKRKRSGSSVVSVAASWTLQQRSQRGGTRAASSRSTPRRRPRESRLRRGGSSVVVPAITAAQPRSAPPMALSLLTPEAPEYAREARAYSPMLRSQRCCGSAKRASFSNAAQKFREDPVSTARGPSEKVLADPRHEVEVRNVRAHVLLQERGFLARQRVQLTAAVTVCYSLQPAAQLAGQLARRKACCALSFIAASCAASGCSAGSAEPPVMREARAPGGLIFSVQ